MCTHKHECRTGDAGELDGAQAEERKYDLFAVCGPCDCSQPKRWPALAHFYVFI